jgi:polyketide synthase PksN
VYDAAAFAIFFVAQLAALQPVYSILSPALSTLDAGYMGQLLMSRQMKFNIGLCPVAGIDFERMRPVFKLDDSHLFIHCLLGGPVSMVKEIRAAQSPDAVPITEYIRRSGIGLTDHVTGALPDRNNLGAVSAAQLQALNALSDAEHDLLHQQRLNIRRFAETEKSIRLYPTAYLHNEFLLRSTQRCYERQPVSFATFSRFLALLKQEAFNGCKKHLYPSAGGLYAVHTYLHIKEAAIEHMASGIYYYNPVHHTLQQISAGGTADIGRAHFPGNRSYYNDAGLSIFLLAQMESLQSFYDSESLSIAMLEAGYIGQVLMDHQAEYGLGVCPIGAMRFDTIRPAFKISGDYTLVHSFLCGPVQRTISMIGHEHLK